MSAPIVVEDLLVDYGHGPVLSGVTFDVGAGEVFALLGPNGAGKTTTVEVLEGHRRRTGGEVRVLGADPALAGRHFRDRIGIVLQSTAVDPGLTVVEAVRLQARAYGDPLRPGDAVELVDLDEVRTRRVARLSGGQLRRLDLALAIVGRPRVLFLDEPTTGFDPEARRWAWRLVRGLRGQGVTVVLTTHALDEAGVLADRIGILDRGRLAALGSPAQLTGTRSVISFVTGDPAAVAAAAGGRVAEGRVVIDSEDPRRDLNRLTGRALERGWALDDLRVGPPDLESAYLSVLERG